MPTTHATAASLRALLEGLIDYAGLFPPTALPLDEAVANYARYLRDPDRWMLGRFICPASRLGELRPFVAELFGEGEPLQVSALGRGGAGTDALTAGLEADLADIAAFREATAGRAVVDVLETRLPSAALAAELAPELARRCGKAGLRAFGEVGFEGAWRQGLPGAIRALADSDAGYKLRSGGVEASAFPSVEQVAFAIATCRDAGCAIKFTAGLHHPVRHFNDSVGTKMHGFLNVFFACLMAQAHGWDESTLSRILQSEDACCFRFRDYGLSVEDWVVSTEQVATIRRDFAISFGSCSFDEPREDLRALELLCDPTTPQPLRT